jgi:processive 1,2-diacylglycerol beta-glucosyltransferase
MITAGTRRAAEQLQRLLALNVEPTVTVGRDERLRRKIASVAAGHSAKILGWTDDLPRLLFENHLLIGKAGGATVQEAIAARCPMIINHIVSGQEEGNAQLIKETGSGTIAYLPSEVTRLVEQALADEARLWRTWQTNISRLSRPRAALEVAQFLLSL